MGFNSGFKGLTANYKTQGKTPLDTGNNTLALSTVAMVHSI